MRGRENRIHKYRYTAADTGRRTIQRNFRIVINRVRECFKIRVTAPSTPQGHQSAGRFIFQLHCEAFKTNTPFNSDFVMELLDSQVETDWNTDPGNEGTLFME